MAETLAQTPLNDWHVEHGARMVDFAGWSMPIQYTSIVAEHQATREAVGVFDVSHMGRLRIEGADAPEQLDRLLTRRVVDLPSGRIRYSLVTNEEGGILDDVLVYHLQTPSERRYFLMVVNASNRERIVSWLQSQLDDSSDVQLLDRTLETAMISVQGPRALETVQPLFKVKLDELGYYHGLVTEQFGRPCTVSRTGYTGEDGFELIVRAEDAVDVCKNLFRAGRDLGISPVGLAARDTLRLEAGMPLYGHELSEQTTPIQAGLGFAVNLKNRQFPGRDALLAAQSNRELPRRVGLQSDGRRVPRDGYGVFAEGDPVGQVTSGTFSPTLQKPIAMAYVEPSIAEVGSHVEVDIRGRREPATVVALPFYRRSR